MDASERIFTEGSEGNEDRNSDLEPFVTFVSFCLRFFFVNRLAADRLDDRDTEVPVTFLQR